jgi:hypothetical protein
MRNPAMNIVMVILVGTMSYPVLAQEDATANQEGAKIETVLPVSEASVQDRKSGLEIDLNLELVNLFVFRNDHDFDDTVPLYPMYGQTEGMLGTFLKPMIRLWKQKDLKFYYETEIGLDLWSEKTPDQPLGGSNQKGLSMKQREIWGEAFFGNFSVRAGFQRLTDSSGLFINHWIGALKLSYSRGMLEHLSLAAGLLPGQTPGGWKFGQTGFGNFSQAVTVFLLDTGYRISENLRLDSGIYFLNDASLPDRLRQAGTIEVALRFEYPDFSLSWSVLGQFGRKQKGAVKNNDARMMAWGTLLTGGKRFGIYSIEGNLIALSADDSHEGNDSTGFLWSGKRPGNSLLLCENKIRDMGDNIDEKMGSFDGWFYEMRPGLAGGELGFYVAPRKWLKFGALTSALFVLDSRNALDHSFAGSENELMVDFKLLDGSFDFMMHGGILIPGGAASAYVNLIDRKATEIMYFTQAELVMRL